MNLNRSLDAFQHVSTLNADILLLQELPKRCNISHEYVMERNGRAAVAYRRSLVGWVVCSKPDFVCAKVGKYTYASLYLDPSTSIDNELLHTVETCSPSVNVLSSDTNAHHPVWGGDKCDGRGEKVFEFALSNQFDIANLPDHGPTWRRRRIDATLESYIDVTFIKGVFIKDWRVALETDSLSDHMLIQFKIGVPERRLINGIFAYSLANWTMLKRSVQFIELPETFSTADEIDFTLRDAITEIRSSVHRYVPWMTKKYTRYNHNLRLMKREVDKAYKEKESSHSVADTVRHLEIRREYRKAIRDTNRNWYSNFLKTHDMFSCLKLLFGSKPIAPSEDPHVSINRYFPDDDETADSPEFSSLRRKVALTLQRCDPSDMHVGKISVDELSTAIERMDLNKAYGPDEISGVYLKRCWTELVNKLVCIYNACLDRCYFPRDLRSARVVLIPKSSTGLRPLAISSYLGRILEYIFLEKFLRPEMPVFLGQYAYRDGISCIHMLHEVVSLLEVGLQKNKCCIVVSLDIKGAFDRAKHCSILGAMMRLNISMPVIAFVHSYLSARTVILNGVEKELTASTPQGGILSPFLFCLYVHELLQLKMEGVKIYGYADDIVLVAQGDSVYEARNRAQKALNQVEAHNKQVMSALFSPPKCWSMLFTRRRNRTYAPLILNGESLPDVRQAKLLGIVIDDKLSFLPHLKIRCGEVCGLLMKYKIMLAKRRALCKDTVMQLYSSIVKPKLFYGVEIWGHRLKNKTYSIIINRCLRLTAICMLCLFRTVRLDTALAEANIPYADMEAAAMMTMARLRGLPHISDDDWLFTDRGRWFMTGAIRTSFTECAFEVGTDIPRRIHSLDQFNQTWTIFDGDYQGITVYVDGSVSHNGCGIGVIALNNGQPICWTSYRVPNAASILWTELHAIRCGLKMIQHMGLSNARLISDSKFALLGVSARSSKRLLDVTVQIRALLSRMPTVLCWVKSHGDCYGNILADLLARYVRGTTLSLPVDLKVTARSVKNVLHTLCAERYDRCERNPVTMVLAPTMSKMDKIRCELTKNIAIARLISGHVMTADYLSWIGGSGTGLCAYCKREKLTVYHIMNDSFCALYSNEISDCAQIVASLLNSFSSL